ncbi:MAG: hypothetical protein JO257_28390 [Deltaproteobacteria bacterium]|nr:hypothetical protein [Deltaproteobacteria bacterium]
MSDESPVTAEPLENQPTAEPVVDTPVERIPPASPPPKPQYPFRVLEVLSTALRITKHNFVPFFLLTCALQVPATLLLLAGVAKYTVLALVVQLFVNAFTQAVVAYGTIMELQGSRPSTRTCIATGFAQLGRVLGVSFVSALAIGGAMLLLVVPGIIVSLMLYVVVPVTLIEGLGIRAAMSRSRKLTDGRKGDICLILMLASGIGILLEAYAYPSVGHEAAIVWRGIVSALTTMFFGVTVAVTYFELRKLRDGLEVPALATAFARIRK